MAKNPSHIRHDTNIEPSQRWYNNKEDGENNTDDHDDPQAFCQRAESALNRLSPFFQQG